LVWIRPITGVDPAVCMFWSRRSLKAAPQEFLRQHKWPTSKTAANRVVAALVDFLRDTAPAPAASAEPLLLDYAQLFTDASTSPRATSLRARGRPYSPGSIATYHEVFTRHVAPDAGLCGLRMDEVARNDLETFFSRLLERLGGPCRTHQSAWAFLHMVFQQWSRDAGKPSPFSGLSKPSYQAEIRRALSESEALAIFSRPENFETALERAAMALVIWAGLRRQEAFALRYEHLDRERKLIRVESAIKAFGRTFAEEGGTKGRNAREVPLVGVVEKAVDELGPKEGYVLAWADGSRPSAAWWNDTFWRVLRRAKIDAGSRKISPHSARHTFASILEAKGVPIGHIQAIMGHRSARTTGGYLHMVAEELERVTKALR